MNSQFYVYVLFRPWDGSPCYVGKGKGGRWQDHERKVKWHPNRHLANIVKKAARLGLEMPKVKIREGLSEPAAFAIEIAFISAIGRGMNGPLVNMTDGGEGSSGFAPSEETKKKHSVASRGNLWACGCKRSPETLAKLRAIQSNRSEATRAKISAANKGKKLSDDHRRKLSAAHTGKILSPDHVSKIADANRGKKRSAEALANLTAAQQKISQTMAEITRSKWADPAFREKTVSAMRRYHQAKRDRQHPQE